MSNTSPALVFVHGARHDAVTWYLQNTDGAVMPGQVGSDGQAAFTLVAGLGLQRRSESAACSAAAATSS
jgi:hypothetical protein